MRWLLLLPLVLCASCAGAAAPATVEGDSSHPSWIVSTSSAGQKICVVISQGELWQPDDDPYALGQTLEASLRFMVDDEPISRSELDIAIPEFVTPVFDDSGKKIGSYGADIIACFDAPAEAGSHTAALELSPRDGVVLSYTWEFNVEA